MKISIYSGKKLDFWSFFAAFTFFGFYAFTTFFETFNITSSWVSYCYRAFVCFVVICFIVPKLRFKFKEILILGLLFLSFLLYFIAILKGHFLYDVKYSKDLFFIISIYISATIIPLFLFLNPDKISEVSFISVSQVFILIILIFSLGNYRSFVEQQGITNTRLYTEKINPIALGHIAVSLFVMILHKIRNKYDSNIIVTIFCLIISLLFILLSQSRGALVSLFFVLIYIFIGSMNRASIIKVIFTLSLITVSFFVYQYIYTLSHPDSVSAFHAFEIIGGDEDQSAQGRFLSYKGAWLDFSDYPFFGKSIEEPFTKYYPHNLILEILMSVGVFGATFFIILFFLVAFKLIKNIKQPTIFYVLFIQYFIGSMFSGALYTSYQLWFCLGAILLCRKINQNE